MPNSLRDRHPLHSNTNDRPGARALSLRDPDGILVKSEEGRLYRFVATHHSPIVERLLQDEPLLEKSRLVRSHILDSRQTTRLFKKFEPLLPWDRDRVGLVLEHESIYFPSFPFEWCNEALVKAGELTLDFAEEALKRNWGLKDATPYNILFEGTQPVFVDWLSVEQRSPMDPTWIAFSQFVRCFLLPLWMDKHAGLPLNASFLSHRDGISPELAYALAHTWRRFTPTFFTLVTLPVWMNRRNVARRSQIALYQRSQIPKERAQFILRRLFQFLRDQLRSVAHAPSGWSPWARYLDARSPYERRQWETKREILATWLEKTRPTTLLDIGCNQGWFSLLAAQSGAKVIGIDNDRQMVRQTWLQAEKQNADVQALYVDLCRPSPGMGWRNLETEPFLSRCQEKFDAVAALAVLHHLTVGEQIPYPEILSIIHSMTRSHFFVEFVGAEDESFRWAAKGRAVSPWDETAFLAALQPYFHIVESCRIPRSHRVLYWLQKRRRT